LDKIFEKKHWDTIIIGGGQAGVAAGYHLKKLNEDFLILDENNRVGDCWRNRWDSLILFTPSQHNGLPGFPFPAERGTFATRDEMADYLEEYVKKFSLPVSTSVKVNQLSKNNSSDNSSFEISTSNGIYFSESVIVATGTNPAPYVPDIAGKLSEDIHQIHSSSYKNPEMIPPGDVLVIGAGTSGAQIAIELSRSRKTYKTFISGNPTPHIPDWLFKYFGGLYWLFISYILTIKTPIGRKARKRILNKGTPLISVSVSDLDAAGVIRLPRTGTVINGYPKLEDGRIIRVSSVIWATGYKPDFSWIDFSVTDDTGWPATNRGISKSVFGLYFAGMKFQYSLTSGLIGGVGRDAEYIANHIHKLRNQQVRDSYEPEAVTG
jgi:putative flavoprotein involved in K+ transport